MSESDKRAKDDASYKDFLEAPKIEGALTKKVLRPGKVKPIHIDDRFVIDWEHLSDIEDYVYTEDEVDALLAAQDELSELDDVCIGSPGRHDFLMYDEVNSCWKEYNLNQDFEDIDPSQITDFHTLSMAFIRIEDALAGIPDLEDS